MKIARVFLIFTLVFSMLCVPVAANDVTTEDLSVTYGCHSIDAKVPMLGTQTELDNVYAAFLYDYTNDTLIYAKNPDERNYPASLVKIMTGLILAEKGNMTDQVTVQEDVLATLPENVLGVNLQAGEILSMEDLFYCTIVESANDAAVVAAVHVHGSQSAFVDEMNRYAKELGCTDTHFTNVTGLHDPEQYSTARDLARILTAAAKNETFMEAFGTVNYTVPATNLSEQRELSSSNYLMNDDLMIIYLDDRVTGGRSGTMDTGERNLAVTAEYNDIHLVSVVLGSLSVVAEDGWTTIEYGSFKETSQLLDLGFQGHHSVQLFYENQALKQYAVPNGESYVSTGITKHISVLLPYGIDYEDLDYRYNEETVKITAPIQTGDWISSVQVWHNDVCLAHADLYALHDVNVAQTVAVAEETQEEPESTPKILILILVIVILLLVLLFGRKIIFRMIHKRRIRRHRKNRRRSSR